MSGDDALSTGLSTADDWRIVYDRFLISLGEVELEGDDCSVYNETDYLRRVDVRLAEPQKVSTSYALGACEFTFRVQSPAEDALLGVGVSPTNVVRFRTAGSDAFIQNAGIVLFVSGSAARAGTTKRFEWAFRRGLQYDDCRTAEETRLTLQSGIDQSLNLRIESTTLFQDAPDEEVAELRFAPFADADDVYGDSDGNVTLEELAQVPLDANPDGYDNYASYLYLELAPQAAAVSRYRILLTKANRRQRCASGTALTPWEGAPPRLSGDTTVVHDRARDASRTWTARDASCAPR